jgi:hypothetical protein
MIKEEIAYIFGFLAIKGDTIFQDPLKLHILAMHMLCEDQAALPLSICKLKIHSPLQHSILDIARIQQPGELDTNIACPVGLGLNQSQIVGGIGYWLGVPTG